MSNLSGLTRVWLTRLVSTRLVTDLYSPSGGRGLPRDPLAGLGLAVLLTRPLSVGTFSSKWHSAVFIPARMDVQLLSSPH